MPSGVASSPTPRSVPSDPGAGFFAAAAAALADGRWCLDCGRLDRDDGWLIWLLPRPSSKKLRILTPHGSRRRTHSTAAAMNSARAMSDRLTLVASCENRATNTGNVPTALMSTGSSALNTVLNPANSGGTKLVSESRGVPSSVVSLIGVGASRTVTTTGPMAPAHAIGIAMANAPTASAGSTSVAAPAPIMATTTRKTAEATRWWAKIHPRSIENPSVRSGRSTSCDSGSSDSRPTRNSPARSRSPNSGDES